jgi:hypothetical protein
MTKNEEISAWQNFAKSLPEDTYTKGAMESLLIEIEGALRSDYLPTLSIGEANSRAVRIVSDAHFKAHKVLDESKKQAAQIIATAERFEREKAASIERLKAQCVAGIEKL